MAYKLSVTTEYIWIQPVLDHPLFAEELNALKDYELTSSGGSSGARAALSEPDLRYLSHTRHVLLIVRATRAFHIIDRNNGHAIPYRKSFAQAPPSEYAVRLPLPPPENDPNVSVTYIDGVLGLIHLIRGYYLVLAVRSAHVASLHGRSIRRVTHTQLLAISPYSMHRDFMGMQRAIAEETRNCEGITSVLDNQHLYFSYSGDIMLPSQKFLDFTEVFRSTLGDAAKSTLISGTSAGAAAATPQESMDVTGLPVSDLVQTVPIHSIAIDLFPRFAPALRVLLASELLSRSDDRFFYNRSHVALLYHAYVSTHDRNHPPRPVMPWSGEPSPLAPFALRTISGFVGEFIITIPPGVKTRLPTALAERIARANKSKEAKSIDSSVDGFTLSEGVKELSLVLITRRSRYRDGPRLMTRGLDHRGNPGAFAETELILQGFADTTADSGQNSPSSMSNPQPLRVPLFVSSFLQVRGSVPVEFRQPPDMSFFTSPPIMFPTLASTSENPSELFPPTVPLSATHFHLNSLRETYFPPKHPHKLTVLSLLNRDREDERDLSLALGIAIHRSNAVVHDSKLLAFCSPPYQLMDRISEQEKGLKTNSNSQNLDPCFNPSYEQIATNTMTDPAMKELCGPYHGSAKFFTWSSIVSPHFIPYEFASAEEQFNTFDSLPAATRYVCAAWNGSDPHKQRLSMESTLQFKLYGMSRGKSPARFAYLMALLAKENNYFLAFNNTDHAVQPSNTKFPHVPGYLAHTVDAATSITKPCTSYGEARPHQSFIHNYQAKENTLLVERQTGLVRSNCVDCIDRTTQAQALLAATSLQAQLSAFGLLADSRVVEAVGASYARLWQAMGDALALMSTGTYMMTQFVLPPLPSIARPVIPQVARAPTSLHLIHPAMINVEGRQASTVAHLLHKAKMSLTRRWLDNFYFGHAMDDMALFSTCYRPGQRYFPFQNKEVVEEPAKEGESAEQPPRLVVRTIQNSDRPATISLIAIAAFALFLSPLLWFLFYSLDVEFPIPWSYLLNNFLATTLLGLKPAYALTRVQYASAASRAGSFSVAATLTGYTLAPGHMGFIHNSALILVVFAFVFTALVLFSGNGLLDYPYLSQRIKAQEFDFGIPNYPAAQNQQQSASPQSATQGPPTRPAQVRPESKAASNDDTSTDSSDEYSSDQDDNDVRSRATEKRGQDKSSQRIQESMTTGRGTE